MSNTLGSPDPHDPRISVPRDDAMPSSRPDTLDYEADPLLRLEKNNQSTRHAVIFFFAIIAAMFGTALLIYLVSQVMGGPRCEADSSAMLCSTTMRVVFAIVPTAIALFGQFGSAWITYARWRDHLRWRAWLAVVWFIMPITLAWVISIGSALLIG